MLIWLYWTGIVFIEAELYTEPSKLPSIYFLVKLAGIKKFPWEVIECMLSLFDYELDSEICSFGITFLFFLLTNLAETY